MECTLVNAPYWPALQVAALWLQISLSSPPVRHSLSYVGQSMSPQPDCSLCVCTVSVVQSLSSALIADVSCAFPLA